LHWSISPDSHSFLEGKKVFVIDVLVVVAFCSFFSVVNAATVIVVVVVYTVAVVVIGIVVVSVFVVDVIADVIQ